MWRVRELQRDLPGPMTVDEGPDLLVLRCPWHGTVAHFVATRAARQEIVRAADKHWRLYHCDDA